MNCYCSGGRLRSVRIRVKSLNSQFLSRLSAEERPVQRIPVTQEFLAETIAAEASGRVSLHPARGCFYNALHDSICNMVGMLAQKYSITCADDSNDLVQDCMLRIVKKIGLFDKRKAAFTTWAWWVCRSVLNKRYRQTIAATEHVVAVEGMDDFSSDAYDGRNKSHEIAVLMDFAQSIRELRDKYPARRNVIEFMFGNPDKAGFTYPGRIVVTEVARATGTEYNELYSFFKGVVRPFLRERLKLEAMA